MPTWAGPFVEYNTLASEFIEYLRPQTIIGKFGTGGVPALHSVPFNMRIQDQTTGARVTGWVQGKAEAADQLSTSTLADLRLRQGREHRGADGRAGPILQSLGGHLQVRQALADALRARLDIDFIDPAKAAVANVSPASITNGVTPITSAGTGVDGVRADLEAVLAAFSAARTLRRMRSSCRRAMRWRCR